MRRRGWRTALTAALLALTPGIPTAEAQEDPPPSPLADFIVTGYGTLGYSSVLNRSPGSDFDHDFTSAVSPVLLFSLGEDVLFEAEFEFELAGSETETAVGYAQIDYLGFGNVQLTAGKFLLPYGLFSERIHPSWINKMPSMPLLYAHAHGGVAEGGLLPVLADIGVMGRWAQPLGDRLTLDVSAWATQGPRAAAEEGAAGDDGGRVDRVGAPSVGLRPRLQPAFDVGHGDAPTQPGPTALEGIPGVAFGTNTTDNNDNKMLGARVGVVVGGAFEIHASGFHSMYDDGGFLDLYSGNLAAEWRPGRFEFRGEGSILWQELMLEEPAAYRTLESPGYYLQASRRIGGFEPVVRWSHLLDAEVESTAVRGELRQLAVGLDYWIEPSIPVKAAFEWNLDGGERVLVQWAYGF